MKNALLLPFALLVPPQRTNVFFMKLFALFLILFASCTRHEKPPVSLTPIQTQTTDMSDFTGDMFQKFKDSLDLAHLSMVQGEENVRIFMAKFKSNPNRIYAVSSLGDEVMYAGMMQDARNGSMAVMKEGEAVLISVKDGVTEINDLDRKQWSYYFTTQYHGGPGFCQRMAGESFSTCYKAESDEFCDSFISCLAVDTQPIVVIAIAVACSCKARPYPPLHLMDSLDFLPDVPQQDTLLKFYKDSFSDLLLDTLP